MTPEQAIVAAREVEVRNPAILDLRAEHQVVDEELVIRVSWSAPDRDTARLDSFQRFARVNIPRANAAAVHGEIEALVREVFEHEFRECFHVRGRRVHEPHEGVPGSSGNGGNIVIDGKPVMVASAAGVLSVLTDDGLKVVAEIRG